MVFGHFFGGPMSCGHLRSLAYGSYGSEWVAPQNGLLIQLIAVSDTSKFQNIRNFDLKYLKLIIPQRNGWLISQIQNHPIFWVRFYPIFSAHNLWPIYILRHLSRNGWEETGWPHRWWLWPTVCPFSMQAVGSDDDFKRCLVAGSIVSECFWWPSVPKKGT